MTAFLLVQPSCIAVQLEGLTIRMMDCLKRLTSLTPDGLLTGWKVVSMTDDIPRRAHDGLAHAFASGDTLASSADALDSSTAVKAASDVNLSFVNFAQQLQYAPDRLPASLCRHVDLHTMTTAPASCI
jgi:hypothetical protein